MPTLYDVFYVKVLVIHTREGTNVSRCRRGILASMIMDNIVINFDLLLERGNNLVIYTKVKCCVAYRFRCYGKINVEDDTNDEKTQV